MKFRSREPGILHNAAHGEGVDGVATRDREDPRAVGHYRVFALADDAETGFDQGAHRASVGDARDLDQGSDDDLDLTHISLVQQVVAKRYEIR